MFDPNASGGATPATITAAVPAEGTAAAAKPSSTGAPANAGGKKEGDNGKPSTPTIIEKKVNGKVWKGTQEEWDKSASLGMTSYERLQEAAKIKKEAEGKLERIKNPKDAIKFLNDPENGYKPDEVRAAFEEWYHENFVKTANETPEQKRIRELEAKNRKYEEDNQKREQEAQAAKEAQEDEVTVKRIQQEVMEIMTEHNLPRNREVARKVIFYTRLNEAKGINAPPELIAQKVRASASTDVQAWTNDLKGEQLVDFLGGWKSPLVKELRRLDIERAKGLRNGGAKPAAEEPLTKEPKERDDGQPKRAAPLRKI